MKILLDSSLVQNVILSYLQQVESVVDPRLLQLIGTAMVPPRWVLHSFEGPCRAAVAKRLNVDSLYSPYFHAQIPVFSSATLAKATHPVEWLTAAIREAARASLPVVWIVEEPAYLAGRGLLDGLLQVLREPSTQFVVCLRKSDETFGPQFDEIPGVSTMRG